MEHPEGPRRAARARAGAGHRHGGEGAEPRRGGRSARPWPDARSREETGLEPEGPFLPLGGVKAHGHKLIFAWAVEFDCDATAITSNTFTMEWPPRSGKQAEFPEVDRAEWFTLEAAREAIVPAQRRFLDDLAVVAAAGA